MFKAFRIVTCILLVLSLSIVLIAETKSNPKGIVGKIGSKSYTYAEYNDLLNNYLNFFKSKEGKQSVERKQELNNQCWEELIGRAIYDSEIKRRGLVITDKEAYDSVIKTPPAQVKQLESLKTNGKFDINKFKKALEVDAKFKQSVLNLVKESMIYDRLFKAVKAEVKIKPDSIKQVWLKDNNLVSAKIINFDFNKIKDIAVADSEAIRYYNEKKETYLRDPARKYKYVKFTADINEPQSKAKAKADSLYQVLINGGDFAALAMQFSADPGSGKNGGDLGWFSHEMMVKPFADSAFALANNAISRPVRSQFGWHIIQTLDKRKNEQGKDEVKARHILIKPDESVSFESLVKEKGLVAAAAIKNYPVSETKEFYENSKSIPEFGGAVDLIKAAFSNSIGYIPAIVSVRGEDIVSELSDSIGVHYSLFDNEKNGIVKILERQKKIAANKALAHEFYNKHIGGDYLAFAAQDSITVVEANDLKEGGNINGIGTVKVLTDSLMNCSLNQYTGIIETETNAYLAYVTKRSKPVLANWEKLKSKLIADADKSEKDKHLNNWYYQQRQKLKVEDNRKDYYTLPAPKNSFQNIQLNPN